MKPADEDQRLADISTVWTAVLAAHAGPTDAASAAQQQILQRYSVAIYRYLLGAVRNPDVAQDLFQDFALRFVRGDFRRADPERGRFRDFLKRALSNLIIDYRRREMRRPAPLPVEAPEPAVPADEGAQLDQAFLTTWLAELMTRTWVALDSVQLQSGQPLHTVLRYRTDHPEVKAPQIAEAIGPLLGKPVTPAWVRKWLHFAREKFADLLVVEVAQTLADPTHAALEQELLDLGLLDRCRAALMRRTQGAGALK